MNRFGASLLAALSLLISSSPAPAAVVATPTLFVHVNVVPMDRERVLRDQSVLVEDGVIRAIAAHLDSPPGARIVDGHGTEYLSPGLADMHVHSTTARDMIVFLANGVTTVLNMGGERASFMDDVVPKLNRGELPGPHFYSSFLVDGTPEYGQFVIATPAEARAFVDIAKSNGYDFIKVYNNLAPDTFQAFIDAGREKGLPVIGHGVTRVGIERQLAAGQMMVAHTEEYLYTVFFPPGSDPGNAVPRLDQIPAAVAFTKRSGGFVTADLNTYATIARQWARPGAGKALLREPQTRFVDPDDRLRMMGEEYATRTGSIDGRLAFLKVFTKALSDGGVPLITGTDTPTIAGLPPGFSLHDDLRALEEAGLSRFQVLSAATRTPGEFIAKAKPGAVPFGTVTVGDRADLVLTAGDPLKDLSTLRRPLGVMGQGRWYDAADLKTLLDGVAAQYAAAYNAAKTAPQGPARCARSPCRAGISSSS